MQPWFLIQVLVSWQWWKHLWLLFCIWIAIATKLHHWCVVTLWISVNYTIYASDSIFSLYDNILSFKVLLSTECCTMKLLLSEWVEMFADDVDDNDMTNSRLAWKAEIDEWLERLKKTEKDLGLKEKELRRREMILRQREKKLEEQFHVVVCILYILFVLIKVRFFSHKLIVD